MSPHGDRAVNPIFTHLRVRALGRGVSQGALWCLLWPPVICRGCSLTAAPQRLYSQVRLQRSRACAVSPKRGLSYYCPSSHSAAQSITMTDCAPACGAYIIVRGHGHLAHCSCHTRNGTPPRAWRPIERLGDRLPQREGRREKKKKKRERLRELSAIQNRYRNNAH